MGIKQATIHREESSKLGCQTREGILFSKQISAAATGWESGTARAKLGSPKGGDRLTSSSPVLVPLITLRLENSICYELKQSNYTF